MNSIEVDDQVLAELERRATGFNVTPNDVLRRVLDLPEAKLRPGAAPNATPPPPQPGPGVSTLVEFIRTERFLRHHQAVDRYLVILGWLYGSVPKQFAKAASEFHRGRRVYFARSENEILTSGDGITAKPIPESPFWALTTLDNKSKRLVLEDLLRALDYSRGDINLVLAELPDSGIRRGRGSTGLFVSL
jgi:negative regulator of replication initiation